MTVSTARRFSFLGPAAMRFAVLGISLLLVAMAALGCEGEGESLFAATIAVDPTEISPTSIFVFDTHEQRVHAVLTSTQAEVGIDAARIEDAQGPAMASVQLMSGHAEVRITAGDNAGLFRATLIVVVGETEIPVPIVAPIAPLPSCDDGNPCTTDYREGAVCFHEPLVAGAACDDNSACTTNDMCHEGLCVGEAVVCSDDVECTQDICDAAEGCRFIPDADACDDGDPCTEESCDIDGGCSSAPRPEGSVCASDGGCESIGFCVQGDCVDMDVPDGFVCDDGDACTSGDACLAGVCTPGTDTGTTAEALIAFGGITVNLCEGFSDVHGCESPQVASPDAVLDVFDADGQSAVLWRTAYLNSYGGACDPNNTYATEQFDTDGFRDVPDEDNNAGDELFIPPQCTASVFLSTYDWDVRTLVSHEFITNARGAVAARFEHGVGPGMPENELHDDPYTTGDVEDSDSPGIPDEDEDADGAFPDADGPIDEDVEEGERGAPIDPPPEPLEQLYRFVVVAAEESGPQVAYLWQAQYVGANNFDRETGHFAPLDLVVATRAGALAVDYVDGVVSALGIEAQRCAYQDPTTNPACFPRRFHYTWNAGVPASSATFGVYDIASSGCHMAGAMVQQPKAAISDAEGGKAVAVSFFNACTSTHEVIARTLGGLTTDVVSPRTFTATTVSSLNLDGHNLHVGGVYVQPSPQDPADPEMITDDGPPTTATWIDLRSAAYSHLSAESGAVAAAAPDMGEGTVMIASGTALAIDNRFDDEGPRFLTLPGGGAALPREIAADNDVAAMSLIMSSFPSDADQDGIPVPPSPEFAIGLSRLSCF